MVWFGHLYHTGKFAFFVSSIFPMHTYLKISSTTCGEEPVKLNTDDRINNDIERKTAHNINNYYGKTEKEIDKRIKELNYEWDTERVLELNFASIVLISSLLGLLSNKKWMALSGITSVFMIQHSLQGWCPPLPLIRRLGVRTATEIFEEKEALKKILNKS